MSRVGGISDPVSTVQQLAAGLRPVGLGELLDRAALQTRTDRKYLVPWPAFTRLVRDLGHRLRTLEIDGQHAFRYASVYFDTADLQCYRDHLQGRRRRYKVRTRCYLDTDQCLLEVKGRTGRGDTTKARLDWSPPDLASLGSAGRQFVASQVHDPRLTEALRPSLSTTYHRTTLLDDATASRVTCDIGIVLSTAAQQLAVLPEQVLVETKSTGPRAVVDSWLTAERIRPVAISKYGVGIALLHPQLRRNRWHRVLHRHFPAAPELLSQSA